MKKLTLSLIVIFWVGISAGFWGGLVSPVVAADDSIQILMRVEEMQYQVKVSLFDKEGIPLRHVKVILRYESGRTVSKETDEEGRLVFDNLPVGRYTLIVELDGRQIEQNIDVEGGDEVINFVITFSSEGYVEHMVWIEIFASVVLLGGFLLLFLKWRHFKKAHE